MKSRSRFALIVAGAALFVGAITTAEARWGKPGLWSVSTTMKMAMGGMPAIPPEQLAKMKKMGIKLPMMDGEPFETQMCVTPEDAAADFGSHHYASADSGCHQESVKRMGAHMIATLVCDGQMKGRGTSDATLMDDGHFATVFTFQGVSHGRPMDMKVTANAHWLGADCGNVKPFVHKG